MSTGEVIERVLIQGDLSKLSGDDRVRYYNAVCDSLSLNPLTRPFEYIVLNGRLTLYAKRECTEQLRRRDKVSVTIVSRELVEGVYVVTARATLPDGRSDESIGAVTVEGLKGEARANSYMRCETKAKRRVTLSICGLGVLDETEVSDIPGVVEPPTQPLTPPPAGALPRPAAAPSGPPTTGAELEARLDAFDSRGAKDGRWARGECVDYVRRAGMDELEMPHDFALWEGRPLGLAMEVAQDFARRHPRKRPEPEPSAS
jgi:hypothetical protein